jgi:hypothetical protein
MDLLAPLRAGRDVVDVDPDVPLWTAQRGLEPNNELGVGARIRDEDI